MAFTFKSYRKNLKSSTFTLRYCPKYGGKGMYGMNVHKAVVENKETESGISIHYVNEEYDDGKLIFQAKCTVISSDTPEDVAQKVHELEYEHFPKIIEKVLLSGQK